MLSEHTPRTPHLASLLVAVFILTVPLVSASHVEDLDREAPFACGGRECIPAIDAPVFDDGAWLAADDRVIGVTLNGVSRAYATRILDWHEIVNDDFGGDKVAVTYCPLCGTAVVFDRTLDGDVLSFGVSGRLYKNDLVMQDRETDTLWSQVLGEAIWGAHHGRFLELLPASTTTWGEWRSAHPDTVALARPDTYPIERYAVYPYGDYESSDRTLQGRGRVSDTFHAKEWVTGVRGHDDALAVSLKDLRAQGIVNDHLGGTPVVIVFAEGAPRAYYVEEGNYSLVADFLVSPSGETFIAATGEGANTTLARPTLIVSFYFAWLDFHPDTRVWLPPRSPNEDASSDRPDSHVPETVAVPAIGAASAAAGVVVLGVFARRFKHRRG